MIIDPGTSCTSGGEPITWHHPLDDIDPRPNIADERRADRMKYARLINALGSAVAGALSEKNATLQGVGTAFWGIAYALDLPCCDGVSMTERAAGLGVTEAALSRISTSFISANDLLPSSYMKREEASISYHEARLASVAKSHNGNGSRPL